MVSKKSKEKFESFGNKHAEEALDKNHQLSFWQLIYLWFRSTTLIQGSFNYGYYQGTGYSQIMFPFFRRIYKGNKEQFKEALIDNIEFFNTGPYFGIHAITALHILMLQNGQSSKDAKKIKFALMGPIAGINDSLFNFGLQPILAGIAASISSSGSLSGFFTWIIIYNLVQFTASIILTVVTYRSGQKFMSNISAVMSSVIKLASMVGITIVGALAVYYTHISLVLKQTSVIESSGAVMANVTDYQIDVLDKFMPLLLPVLLVGFTYFMMSKYGWSIYKVLVFILMLGVVGYAFGVIDSAHPPVN